MMKLSNRVVAGLALLALAAGSAAAGEPDKAPAKPAAAKPAADKAPAKPEAKPEAKTEEKAAKPEAKTEEKAALGAEVKAAKGVEQREPVEEGTSFTAGTKVWVWSRVTGAKDTRVKHVWKKDGKEIWSTPLAIKSDRWVTHSRRTVSKAGEYSVDVVGADGSSLGSVTFTVQ